MAEMLEFKMSFTENPRDCLPEHGEEYLCQRCGRIHKAFDRGDHDAIIRASAKKLAESIDAAAADLFQR